LAASACSADPGVLDDDCGQGRGPRAEDGHRAGPACPLGVVVAVDVLAREGDEETALFGLPAVEHGRRGHRHRTVARDRPADDRGDLSDAERDHYEASQFRENGRGKCRIGRAVSPVVMRWTLPACCISPAYRKPHTLRQHFVALTVGMTHSEPDRRVADRPRSQATPSSTAIPATGITVYGCGPDEAALFREKAFRFGVTTTITAAAVSAANIDLASGNRCISVGHKSRVANSVLLALGRAGVKYISTRSIGCNHIDVEYAASVGITVENVAYSPDSVADYTLMLMLMAVRNAKTTVRRADHHDYRLNEVRGKELRDLTVGVVGTGRIGTAVMERLRGFGGRTLSHDPRALTSAVHIPLDDLLRLSDIVTLHAPLTTDTYHLLDRRRIGRMKLGAFVINTGRGPLIDTEALVSALAGGRLGGAALDVIEGEEGVFYTDCRNKHIESKALLRLQEMPNVLITPHTAYYTEHALIDTVENSIANCLTFERRNQHG
jgi:D-specific alpha-keto acid dehydrogenase